LTRIYNNKKGKIMITIYGKPQCPFCEKAKNLCEQKGYEYTYKILGKDYQINELLETFPGAKTVPQIMIDGEIIGGYSQLEAKLKD